MYFNHLSRAVWGFLWPTDKKKNLISYYVKGEEYDGAIY